MRRLFKFFLIKLIILFNPSLMWWDTPGNCSNHGEILEQPGGIRSN